MTPRAGSWDATISRPMPSTRLRCGVLTLTATTSSTRNSAGQKASDSTLSGYISAAWCMKMTRRDSRRGWGTSSTSARHTPSARCSSSSMTAGMRSQHTGNSLNRSRAFTIPDGHVTLPTLSGLILSLFIRNLKNT